MTKYGVYYAWRCRGPGGSHRLQNGWGGARRGPRWGRLPYASALCVNTMCVLYTIEFRNEMRFHYSSEKSEHEDLENSSVIHIHPTSLQKPNVFQHALYQWCGEEGGALLLVFYAALWGVIYWVMIARS